MSKIKIWIMSRWFNYQANRALARIKAKGQQAILTYKRGIK